MRPAERLTPIEASFVELEQPRWPMHVAGLVVFERKPRPLKMDELRRLVASRLKRARGFHEVVRTRFGEWPEWEHARRIKPSSHLFHHVLRPPAAESQLLQLCAEIHEQTLDRTRPLWEIHLIDGVPGGCQALLIKTHHAITDGLAGVEIAQMLFDPKPGIRRLRPPVMRFAQKDGTPSPWTALQALVGLAFTAAGGPLAAEGPFNSAVRGQRTFGTATLSMQAVKRVKRQLGVSVDDVLAATVAAGISRYLKDVQYPMTMPALRAMLPVSTRGAVHGASPRNDVSAIFVDLPMHVNDVPTLVRSIAEAKATLRTAHAAAGSSIVIKAAGLLPAPVHAALLRFVAGLPFANLVLSDTPGPDQDLYLLGRRIRACYPMLPLSPNIGLSIAMLSMSGAVGIGVTADPSIVPDVQHLASAIQSAWPAFEEPVVRAGKRRAA